MLKEYHQQITRTALGEKLSENALQAIIKANLKQDALIYQVGHSHFHFDDNSFAESNTYIEEQRKLVRLNLEEGTSLNAWIHFGRLSHTAQDLYAHSNYVDLWLKDHDQNNLPLPETIDPCDDRILTSVDLISGKLYYPLEALSFISRIRKFVLPLLPRDSHAWMNLDGPASGNRFAYAFSAAVKRTGIELEQLLFDLTHDQRMRFTGKSN